MCELANGIYLQFQATDSVLPLRLPRTLAATVLDQLDKLGILSDAKCVASVAKVIVDTKLGDGFIPAHLGTHALARVGRAGNLASSQSIIGFALSVGGVAYICAGAWHSKTKIDALSHNAFLGARARNSRTWVKRLALPIGWVAYICANTWHSKAKIDALSHNALLVQWAGNSIADINVLAHASIGVASLSEGAWDSGTKIWLIVVRNKVPLGIGRSAAESIVEDLPKGIDNTGTVAESNDNILSRTLVVIVVELIGIVVSAAATKSTFTAAVLVTNLELGKKIFATGVGVANEPVASVVENNVQIGNVALLLADAKLLGALEGLVYRHDRSILLEKLKEGIECSRHFRNGSCVNLRDCTRGAGWPNLICGLRIRSKVPCCRLLTLSNAKSPVVLADALINVNALFAVLVLDLHRPTILFIVDGVISNLGRHGRHGRRRHGRHIGL